jgi:cell wall-associated NlpC family hydrolase
MQTLMILMAMQYLNVPYKWGGDNYEGMDCSGFVLKVLDDVGITLPRFNAQMIYDWCLNREGAESTNMVCDSFLFFGKSSSTITHIGISMGEINGKAYMIEAGGAGQNSLSMNKSELAKRDARVRIKPVGRRRDLIASIKIPY